MRCAASGSSMIALSVISRHSADGGSACSRSVASTTPASRGLDSWRGERLTAITKSSWPWARHAAAWRQASPSTHSPIGTIRPLCSATGTKRRGGDRAQRRVLPAQQRLDAEHARRVGEHDLGLVGERELARRRARRAARPRAPAARRRVSAPAVEELQLRLAALLGLVHGGVGVAQQLLGGHVAVGAVGDRDADARGEEALAAVEHERALDLVGDAVGDPAQVGRGS